ncbi:MAG TPA: class I SAM-dependent methyltransferase [Gammaproteobacteria bacterium]|nr:class I SAM-dependent methyltransferase [Gammaproteobacteria bacterium]
MVDDPIHHYQQKSIAETYDAIRFSSIAGKAFDALEKHYVRTAFRGLAPNSTIVDAPCGTGRLAEVLLEDGYRVAGVDISSAMLAQAQRKLARFGERFSWRTADMMRHESLPPDNYDAALCARVLMHFPPDRQIVFLRNIAAITTGRIVFTHSWTSSYQKTRHRVKRLLRHQVPVRYPVSKNGLADLLDGAGLRELGRLRPCPPLTEEIIIVAQRR